MCQNDNIALHLTLDYLFLLKYQLIYEQSWVYVLYVIMSWLV